MKRVFIVVFLMLIALSLRPSPGMCAYSHGDTDSPNFLIAYRGKETSKLNSCELCHRGQGQTETPVGTCNWCHTKYGYNGTGNIAQTLNSFGTAYLNAGRNVAAFDTLKALDSDGDGYTNDAEILADSNPGYAGDKPGMASAPSKVYTMAQIEALPQHSQFMLMNTNKQVDSYGIYTGVPIKDLLDDAGIDLSNATGITVYSLDGYSANYPLYPTPDSGSTIFYHVYGNMTDGYQYPPALYWYKDAADTAISGDSGWCTYSAASCAGRSPGDSIAVGDGGLKALLAIKYEGAYLVPSETDDNGKLTLDSEGPFRTIVPQKYVTNGWPDMKSTAQDPDEEWNYNTDPDHNAGMCAKAAIVIRVDPLPEGTTDIDTKEAFDTFIGGQKIVIYGAIEGDDGKGAGEETAGSSSDSDDNDDWCFIGTASIPSLNSMLPAISFIMVPFAALRFRKRSHRDE